MCKAVGMVTMNYSFDYIFGYGFDHVLLSSEGQTRSAPSNQSIIRKNERTYVAAGIKMITQRVTSSFFINSGDGRTNNRNQ